MAEPKEEPSEEPSGAAYEYCKECEMWLQAGSQWQDHLIGKKHKKKLQSLKQSDISAPGEVPVPTVRIQVAGQDVPSLVIPVYDVGGTESGTIELSPEVSWCEMAASWRRETGTNLLPPEGTRPSTIAAEIRDKVLTAVVLVAT